MSRTSFSSHISRRAERHLIDIGSPPRTAVHEDSGGHFASPSPGADIVRHDVYCKLDLPAPSLLHLMLFCLARWGRGRWSPLHRRRRPPCRPLYPRSPLSVLACTSQWTLVSPLHLPIRSVHAPSFTCSQANGIYSHLSSLGVADFPILPMRSPTTETTAHPRTPRPSEPVAFPTCGLRRWPRTVTLSLRPGAKADPTGRGFHPPTTRTPPNG